MKTTIEGSAFNGNKVNCRVELFLDGMPKFIPVAEKATDRFLPVQVYAVAQKKVLTALSKAFPQLKLEGVNFSIVSRDIENMRAAGITPDPRQLGAAVGNAVLHFILESLHIDSGKTLPQRLKLLAGKRREFDEIFLSGSTLKKNSGLERVSQLYQGKKYPESFQLLASIDRGSLSFTEKKEFDYLQFSLLLKNSDRVSDHLDNSFYENIDLCRNDPVQAKRFFFAYIRFAEDCRETRRPRKLLQQFEEKYPVSILDDIELSLYYYLKGRAEYGRGEFLDALKLLTQALATVDHDDRQMVAAIYNTSVNSFTDNLFFDEARYIADQALAVRELLNLPERMESLSCLGGIACKQGDFVTAFDYYSRALALADEFTLTGSEQNRLYNYLAKVSVLLQKYEAADDFLDKARAAGDPKGFSACVQMIMDFQKGDFAAMRELFQTTFMLPENHRDYDNFTLGWAYAYMARAAFSSADFRDGVIYIFDAISFFLDDNYILEAGYISLYLYLYSVPPENIEIFRKLESDLAIMDKLGEYIDKHARIRDRFFQFYDGHDRSEAPAPTNLELFYNNIIDIDDYNYNPDTVAEILNSFCLL